MQDDALRSLYCSPFPGILFILSVLSILGLVESNVTVATVASAHIELHVCGIGDRDCKPCTAPQKSTPPIRRDGSRVVAHDTVD